MSPAAQAGLRTGDVVTFLSTDGETWPVRTWSDLVAGLEHFQSAEKPSLQVALEGGEKRTLELGAAPSVGSVAEALGLSDSQLTVARLDGPSKLREGDRLISFEGEPIADTFSLYEKLTANQKSTVQLGVLRDGEELEITQALRPVDTQKASGKVTVYAMPAALAGLSVYPQPYRQEFSNPLDALSFGIRTTWEQSAFIADALWGLVTGEVPLKALGGPMLIAKVAGDTAQLGWEAFVRAVAIISINLGLINLVPIPVLDGGQILLTLVEVVRRRPLDMAALENFYKIGFIAIAGLVVLTTYNDLSRFWGAMLSGVKGLFE